MYSNSSTVNLVTYQLPAGTMRLLGSLYRLAGSNNLMEIVCLLQNGHFLRLIKLILRRSMMLANKNKTSRDTDISNFHYAHAIK